MIPGRAALVAVLLVVASGARGQLFPADDPGLIPAGAPIVDDHGRTLDLMNVVRGAGPALLLPVFTRCSGTCPLLARGLRAALAKATPPTFRVVVLTFDGADTESDLRAFRRDMSLPDAWTVARGRTEGDTRRFLDQFHYTVMQNGGGFAHPSEALVFSGGGRWCATLVGTEFSPEALASAASRARAIDSPAGTLDPLGRLTRPQVWAAIAAVVAAIGVGLAYVTATRSTPIRRSSD